MGKGDGAGGGGGQNFCEVNIFILCAIIVCWTMESFRAAICTYSEFLFICDSLPPYYLAFTLSMFEGTNVHNLHNIVLCIDVCIKRPYFLLNI